MHSEMRRYRCRRRGPVLSHASLPSYVHVAAAVVAAAAAAAALLCLAACPATADTTCESAACTHAAARRRWRRRRGGRCSRHDTSRVQQRRRHTHTLHAEVRGGGSGVCQKRRSTAGQLLRSPYMHARACVRACGMIAAIVIVVAHAPGTGPPPAAAPPAARGLRTGPSGCRCWPPYMY
eukprot:COSAG01_NODE_587_length_15149_cov_13.592558_12_plen_179_part_00